MPSRRLSSLRTGAPRSSGEGARGMRRRGRSLPPRDRLREEHTLPEDHALPDEETEIIDVNDGYRPDEENAEAISRTRTRAGTGTGIERQTQGQSRAKGKRGRGRATNREERATKKKLIDADDTMRTPIRGSKRTRRMPGRSSDNDEKTADAKEYATLPTINLAEYLEVSIADPHAPEDFLDNPRISLSPTTSDTALPNGNNRRVSSTYDRALRLAARHVHLLCLLAAYRIKSCALGAPILQAHLLSLLPPHLMRQFSVEHLEDGRTLLNALSMLSNWWKNNMKRTSSVGEGVDEMTDLSLIRWLPQRRHHAWLRTCSANKTGSDEDLVAMFVATLRALGLPTRLLVSLQPVLMRPTVGTTADTDIIVSSSGVPPRYWCEVWHAREGKWISVDCLRAVINDRLGMEPATGLLGRIGRQHLFIVAFDQSGNIFDVTRRYTSRYYGWTAKLRRSDEAVLASLMTPLPSGEETELAALVDGEPIPQTLSGFHGHGRYMLERQLHKYEVFYPPDAGIVGEFRGEQVRLRSAVQPVRSKEAWYTQYGRVIREGEVPAKVVKLPKKPERVKKKQAWERALEAATRASTSAPPVKEYVDQPLWGEWQTVPFQPAVAQNGQVPRNKFGNVDLYLPSMLPIGCVWIDDDQAWKAAKDLEIDYAAACIRFAFSGRFAVPNLRGIVICQEYEGAVLRRLVEIKREAIGAEEEEAAEEERQRARLEKKKRRVKDKLAERHGIDMDAGMASHDQQDKGVIISALAGGINNDDSADVIDDLF